MDRPRHLADGRGRQAGDLHYGIGRGCR
jgi:hypothetical protein